MGSFGSSEFGPAQYGGDPTPYLWFEVDAEITSRARAFLARGAIDGTSIQVQEFSLGSGGIDPFDYHAAVPVNPDAIALDIPLVPSLVKPITHYERPNTKASCVYCVLEQPEANDLLGEIAIWGKVLYSPYTSEIGDTFLAAIAHFPLIVKNDSMKYAFRVNVQF